METVKENRPWSTREDTMFSEADGDDISTLLGADPQILSRRVDFVRALRQSSAPAISASVRVLNPRFFAGTHAGAAEHDDVAGSAPSGPSGSEPAPLRNLFPPDQLLRMLSWPAVRGAGPGLSNLGQTCFMSAVLQALAYTPPIANLCLGRYHSRACRALGFCAYCELEKLLVELHGSSARSLAPSSLVRQIRLVAKHFRLGKQQDAHEYFLCLVEKMQEAALACRGGGGGGESRPLSQTTEVFQTFGGRIASTVRCLGCGHVSTTIDEYLDLSLELRKAPSVRAALRQFTAPETLKDDNRRCTAQSAAPNLRRRRCVAGPGVAASDSFRGSQRRACDAIAPLCARRRRKSTAWACACWLD